MPHLFTILAIVHVILGIIYLTYVPKEDYEFMVYVVAALMPFGFLAIGVDKLWGIIKMIHPVISLAIVVLMGVFVAMAGQPFNDSLLYLGVVVILVLPMLVISLCMNFHGF